MEFENSYINRLYDGQINPMETVLARTKAYTECENKIESLEDELKGLLTEEAYKKIELLSEIYNDKCGCFAEKGFEVGFKHGIMLMTSVFKTTTEDE